jgi:hypothetical protein
LVSITNVATGPTRPIVSGNAYLTVVIPPADRTADVGTNVSFTALAVGPSPLGYQWQFNGTNLTNGGRISGATTTNLTLSNVTLSDAGEYCFIVTNAAGVPTNFCARLDVRGPCHGPAIRLVPCPDFPSQWCVEVCWGAQFCLSCVQWTSDPNEPVLWQPCSLGPITETPGCKCMLIHPVPGSAFFQVRSCPPAPGP